MKWEIKFCLYGLADNESGNRVEWFLIVVSLNVYNFPAIGIVIF